MRALIALTLVAIAVAQFHWPFFQGGHDSDRHAGYRFEYHSRHHLLLVRDDQTCYLIDAPSDVVQAFHDKAAQDGLEDDIISHIKSHMGTHTLTHFDALHQFHDFLEAAECRRRDIVALDYQLNAGHATTMGTTMGPV